MNSENFIESWVKTQLLPWAKRINRKLIVIMDNAPYHVTPTDDGVALNSNTSKSQLYAFCEKNGIAMHPDTKATGGRGGDTTQVLKDKIIEHLTSIGRWPQPMRVVDVLEAEGHRVLFTPPYHPELQPIEMLWARVKGFIANSVSEAHVRGRTMDEVAQLALDGFALESTPAKCQKLILHALEETFEYMLLSCITAGQVEAGEENNDEDIVDLTLGEEEDDVESVVASEDGVFEESEDEGGDGEDEV